MSGRSKQFLKVMMGSGHSDYVGIEEADRFNKEGSDAESLPQSYLKIL